MEEDIKILEFYKESEIWFPLQNVKKPMFPEREKQALENLLKRYKELEEDNTEWRGKYLIELAKVSDLEKEILHWKGQYHLLSRKINVIPISVIQNKIKDEQDKILYFEQISETANAILHYRRQQVLQELLEERK